MASIIVMSGSQEGDYYLLSPGSNVIGRLASLQIHILDMTISREHMDICFDDQQSQYFAIDLNSQNGVFVDEIKVNGRKALAEGNRITIGKTDLLFTQENITDRESSLHRLRMSKLTLPTMDITRNTQELDTLTFDRSINRYQGLRDWAGSSKITLAIVFTDMVDSTLLTHTLGNERMDEVRRSHFARARSLIEEYEGYEIKTNGDEFMVTFRTAVNAVDFAVEFDTDTGDDRIKIRVGVHIGPVVIEEDDVQGAAVSYAARVMNMGVSGGVWISSEVKSHIDQEKPQRHEGLCWEGYKDCVLKGFPGKHVLFSAKKNP
ncbi:MAG: adenylate/guanylate cyclase domain-containing protein [Planctomycetota bacterium]|jgi:class 3 adenylate cyclase